MLTVSTQTVLVSLTVLFGLATGAPLLGHPEAESESGSEKPLVTIGEEAAHAGASGRHAQTASAAAASPLLETHG